MVSKDLSSENNIWEQSKEALQPETQKNVRTSARHFVAGTADGDNAYPTRWGMLVNKYLSECYRSEDKGHEVSIDDRTYQILKREKVTVFYDHEGNTLFDVENERLAEEAKFYEDKQEEKESGDSQEEITETSGEEDLTEPSGADGNENTGEEKEEVRKEVPKVDPETKESGAKAAPEETKAVPVPDNIGEKAEEKLRKELGKEDDKKYAEPIIEYLIKRCLEDKGLAEDVMQKHKSWKKCFDYIYSQARKQAKGNRGSGFRFLRFVYSKTLYSVSVGTGG